VLATDYIVLPGETATIWTEEDRLIEDCVAYNYGVLALAVIADDDQDEDGPTNEGLAMDDTDDDDEENLLEIASLCEIKEVEDGGDDGLFVTVTSVGRVRLDRLKQSYPYFKFYCKTLQEEVGNLRRGNLVADNIESFMRKLTHREKELKLCESDEESLVQRYKRAYGHALQTVIAKNSSRNVQLLTAISWAAFTAVDDPELEHYRIQALDWDCLYERLKLAQYMLREKELRLYGYSLTLDKPNSIAGLSTAVEDSTFSEGFQ
jgi:Lon protease-like protein